jgi:hypothetical protein
VVEVKHPPASGNIAERFRPLDLEKVILVGENFPEVDGGADLGLTQRQTFLAQLPAQFKNQQQRTFADWVGLALESRPGEENVTE